jgi:hypothetical protein
MTRLLISAIKSINAFSLYADELNITNEGLCGVKISLIYG